VEEGRIIVASPAEAGGDSTQTLGAGERIGLSFRRGHKKCMCATTVVGHTLCDTETPGIRAACLELQWPQTLQELQRRVYYRVTPPGKPVLIRLWRGGVVARPNAEQQPRGIVTGTMLDLSAGGVRVVSTDVDPEMFTEGESIGCAFTPKARGETFVLDAIFRHFLRDAQGQMSFGLQFVGLEATDRGRKMLSSLARVVTDFQRENARGSQRADRGARVGAR
jgi:hypothetical protein